MSLRDQIRQVVSEHDGSSPSVVDQFADSDSFGGVAPELIGDAVRHYADTGPIEHADLLADFLVSESDVGSMEEIAHFEEAGNIPIFDEAESDFDHRVDAPADHEAFEDDGGETVDLEEVDEHDPYGVSEDLEDDPFEAFTDGQVDPLTETGPAETEESYEQEFSYEADDTYDTEHADGAEGPTDFDTDDIDF